MQRQGHLPAKMEPTQIADNYIAAVKKGILKVMSKMGISTLRSYRSAQFQPFTWLTLNTKRSLELFLGERQSVCGSEAPRPYADRRQSECFVL